MSLNEERLLSALFPVLGLLPRPHADAGVVLSEGFSRLSRSWYSTTHVAGC